MAWLKFCVFVVWILSGFGCSRTVKIPSDTLVVAISAQPLTLDPRLATDATGMRICNLLFNALVHVGPNLELVPDAAESWSYKDHVFQFTLRPDLRFHNGRALVADDIAFSFEQFRAGGPFASGLGTITDVRVETRGNGRIVAQLRVKNFSDKFLRNDLPAVKLLPKVETLAAGRDFGQLLIGTGGFRLVRQSPETIELAGVTAASKHLIFKIVRDDFTRFQKMRKGEIDIIQQDLPPDKVAAFQALPKQFVVYLYPGLSMTYLLLNFRDPMLRQLRVRQALDQSISRPDLIRYKMYDHASAATSLLTPNNPYFDTSLQNLPFSPATAAATIKSLGLNGHGLTLKTSNTPQAIENGKVLVNQMKQTGLDVQAQSFEWGTFYSDIKKGNFQLATMRWVGTLDPDLYRLAFHSKEFPPGRNRGSYSNAKLDQLLEATVVEESVSRRREMFLQVQKIVHNDLAIIPLWYDQQIAVAKTIVKDYRPDATGEYYSLLLAHKDRE